MNNSYYAVNEAQSTCLLAMKATSSYLGQRPCDLGLSASSFQVAIYLESSNLIGSVILFYPLIDNDRVHALLLILKIILNFRVKKSHKIVECTLSDSRLD